MGTEPSPKYDCLSQDAMDILLGNYVVGGGEGTLTPSPLDQKNMRPENLVMVALLLVGAAMLTIALFLPTVHVAHYMTQVHAARTLSNGTDGTGPRIHLKPSKRVCVCVCV
jgi:hypothetical protein